MRHELKDGTYGPIVKLTNNRSFSDEDIKALNAEPERLLEWYWGNATLPSGIVKEADDKVWAVMEDSGDTLYELSNLP